MKNLIFLALLSSFTWAQSILPCEEYTKKAQHVIGISPPINMMLQTLNDYKFPAKISKKDEIFKKLSSIETLVSQNIDLVILWNSTGDYSNLASKLAHVGIDTCSLDLSSLKSYVQGYKTLGSIMNKEKRAEELSSYIQEKLEILKNLREKNTNKKALSIYYTKSEDGLVSECQESIHSEPIFLIGALNPLSCLGIKNMRMTINLEKLFVMNPEVILTTNKKFFANVQREKKYSVLQAVKNKKVFLVPNTPINWLDNPPSFFKILGVFWLGKQVYPEVFTMDLKKEQETFFKLFLHRGLDE